MNWTAVVVTALICGTITATIDKAKEIAKLWLESIKAQRDIHAMHYGFYKPGRNGR
jgi:hypothetical protein